MMKYSRYKISSLIFLIPLIFNGNASSMFWAEDQIEPTDKGTPCQKGFTTIYQNLNLDKEDEQENKVHSSKENSSDEKNEIRKDKFEFEQHGL